MSSYGPPGGPPGGTPPPGDSDSPRYGDPADPWGTQPTDPWATPQPASPWDVHPPTAPGEGYQPPAEYTPPEHVWPPSPAVAPLADPRPRRRTALVAGLVVLLVLLGGGGAAAYVLSRDRTPAAQPSDGPTTPPTGTPSTRPAQPPGGTAEVNDVRNVKVGQCVVNRGTEDQPRMEIVACAKDTFEVLRIEPQTIDPAVCDKVNGYTNYYYYNSTLDSLDYVLCLRQR